MIRPSSSSHTHAAPHSPPRPVKSEQARQAAQRGWSASPTGPHIPHRGLVSAIKIVLKLCKILQITAK